MTGDFLVNWFADWEGKHEQFYAYAEMYKEAVITITNAMNSKFDLKGENPPDQHPAALAFHDYGIIPAMFLFRHYVELHLKGLILHKNGILKEIDKTHGIKELLELLKEKTKTPRISKQSENIITELQQLDYTSQGFRYPYDKSGKRFFENTKEEDLKQVNMMTEFMSRANIVFSDLENQEGDFTAEDEVESLD